uniref:uncharacterized protein cd34 n=1 Tax=Semicossyphus pulcher TaxID=241346 RepID=UPI0037E8BB21
MAAHMWRMNGLWRRMAGVLLLCALLLSNEVMCQDDAQADPTDAPAADPAADPGAVTDASAASAAPGASAAPDAGAAPTDAAAAAKSAASAAPGASGIPATIVTVVTVSNPDGSISVTDSPAAPVAPEVTTILKTVVPVVKCVGKDDIPESDAIKVSVETTDCEATKRIIQENPAGWCNKDNCNLEISQDGKTIKMASDDAKLSTLADAVQSSALKDKLGVTKVETPSSSSSSVFAGILVSGLLAAIGITAGYFKCQRRGDAKGVRLAEEAYPVDQENQGNTLVSVAPLNPPPDTLEKPSVNGESPEAAKTEPTPPPTNGTSTTKTADTEL